MGTRNRQGFTLVEILLAIALIALFVGTVVVNVQGMLNRNEIDSVEDSFWSAVDKAKQNAVFQQRKYRLQFDEDERAFIISSGERREVFDFELGPMGEDLSLDIRFTEKMANGGSKLIGGRRITDRDVERVLFFPDGTCTPFTVSLGVAEYRIEYNIDPWTAAPLVQMEDDR